MKRVISLAIGLLAYVGPAVWADSAIEADRKAQLASHGWVCGNPMIGVVCLAGIAASLLSLVATGFGIAALREMPEPRPKVRLVELSFVFTPFVIAGSYVALLLLV